MKTENIQKIKLLFDRFKSDKNYLERVRNLQFSNIAKLVISETLKGDNLTNEQLTGLIQICKVNASQSTLKKYLEANVSSEKLRTDILDKINSLEVRGYTAAGRFKVSDISEESLVHIRKFLKSAFEVVTVDDAIKLVRNFESLNVPIIKYGIYSPWLYYIKPDVFPIVNSSNDTFRKWMDIRGNYSDIISKFNTIKDELQLNDLGLLDSFIYFSVNDILKKKDEINLRIFTMSLSDEKLTEVYQKIKDNYNHSADVIKKEFYFRNNIDEMANIKRFWLVGSFTSLKDSVNLCLPGKRTVTATALDQTEFFVENNIWINGYKNRYKDVVQSIKVGDKIAIKAVFAKEEKSMMRIKSVGIVTGNQKDGRILQVDWSKNFEQFDVDFSGGYWATIAEVKNEEHISKIWI